MLGALIGSLPTEIFAQNVGIIETTKVTSRRVFSLTAIFILVSGLIPKLSALLTTIPYPVLGGATLSVFASITMSGIKMIASQPLTPRNTTIVGISVAIGMGFNMVCQEAQLLGIEFIRPELYTAIGSSPVVLATICALLLNVIFKEGPEDRAKA